MRNGKEYYMQLLEGRAKRLNRLINMAAPTDMICKEIKLLVKAAQPLSPTLFKKDNHEI